MKLITLLLFAVLITTADAQNITEVKMADVVHRINQPNDTTYIVNFWATFCKPCLQEMPGLLKAAEKYKTQKVKMLLVSVDLPSFYPKRIASFVAAQKWKASVAWLNETNADYFCPMIDSAWSGAIPATVVVNAKRGYKKFWEGEVSEKMLESELLESWGFINGGSLPVGFTLPMKNITAAKYYDDNNHPTKNESFYRAEYSSLDSSVFSVLDGTVTSIVRMDSIQIVFIKKKNWLYTFSNLKTALVKKNDVIMEGQIIGYAANDFYLPVPKVELYFSDIEKEMQKSDRKQIFKK